MDNNINQKNNKFKQIFRYQFVYVALLILMAVAVIMNINTGNVHISPVQIGKIIFLRVILEHLNTILYGKYAFHDYVWQLFLVEHYHYQVFCCRLFQKSYSWPLRAWYIIRSQDVCCYYDDIFT